MTGNGVRERVVEKIFIMVIHRAKNVLKVCIDDYDYDIKGDYDRCNHGELLIILKHLRTVFNLLT